jgi:serine/threonine protein kinase
MFTLKIEVNEHVLFVHFIMFLLFQVKCYMHQLLSGLEHCHNHGVLHRDIKGSNLLIDNGGILKIADFGLASTFDPNHKRPMTSRVVTLWYRPPELLLGATDYSVGVDLWSAGCILAELLAGKPIMPGRTEVTSYIIVSLYFICCVICQPFISILINFGIWGSKSSLNLWGSCVGPIWPHRSNGNFESGRMEKNQGRKCGIFIFLFPLFLLLVTYNFDRSLQMLYLLRFFLLFEHLFFLFSYYIIYLLLFPLC